MRVLEECPVCASRHVGRLYVGRTTRNPADAARWHVDTCRDCGHDFLNPQPDWEDLSGYYSEDYAPYDAAHGSAGDDDAAEATARASGEFRHLPLPSGKRLLDVGCGAGFFLRIARRLGATVEGVEPSAIAAERARRAGLTVFTGTLEDFSRARPTPGEFDVITANHVIEHVPRPVETFAAMKRLLADGGVIWVAVPNGACRWAKGLQWRWHSGDLPYHLMQFSPGSLSKAAERAGLAVRRLYTHTAPEAAACSMGLHLRYRWMVPRRLSGPLLSRRRMAALARRMDAGCQGEAILVELEHPHGVGGTAG